MLSSAELKEKYESYLYQLLLDFVQDLAGLNTKRPDILEKVDKLYNRAVYLIYLMNQEGKE